MFGLTEPTRLTEFERKILPHLDSAYNLARFLMRDDQDAEDVVQEASLRAFRFFENFHGENSRAWFLSIVRNTSFTALKRNRMDETNVPFDEELHGAQTPPMDAGVALDRAQDRQTVRAAIEQGFARAFGTIIDTHMTTIISALFLFQFGTGPIKGFAVTLLIGLFASVFTAFFVSRVIFDVVYKPEDRPSAISI